MGAILAGLLLTQLPTPAPPSYRAAMNQRVQLMVEHAARTPRVERAELARRLAVAVLALDGREPLTGRTIAGVK
jgi:hypothetical protein